MASQHPGVFPINTLPNDGQFHDHVIASNFTWRESARLSGEIVRNHLPPEISPIENQT